MPAVAQSRKIIKLPQSLHHDLTVYALAAGAAGVSVLALAQPAQAQIVYTPAHSALGRVGEIRIDLNGDGVTDIAVRESPWVRFSGGISLAAVPAAGGAIQEGSYGWAAALWPGSKIGAPHVFTSKADAMALLSQFGAYYYASWAPLVRDRYLGIKFLIDGETHYGWARLTVSIHSRTKHIGAMLTGYAYETRPDTPIRAGDMGNNHADSPTSEVFSAPQSEAKTATLGALALGASGLAIWRHP
jgi:hypothetical protein